MNFKLKVWRQKDRHSRGKLVDYDAPDIPAQASLLEMLDIVNERLVLGGHNPIAFNSDSKARCRSFDGSGGLHRLRRVRRRVSKCIGDVVYRGKSFSPRPSATRRAGTNQTCGRYGARDGCRRFWQLYQYLRMRSG